MPDHTPRQIARRIVDQTLAEHADQQWAANLLQERLTARYVEPFRTVGAFYGQLYANLRDAIGALGDGFAEGAARG